MTNIKSYIDRFQIKHSYGSGYHIAYLAPSVGGYIVIIDDHCDHSRIPSLPIVLDNETIMVNDELMIVNLKNYNALNVGVSVVPVDKHEFHIDSNNKTLDAYRNGSFVKQRVYLKFVESIRLTRDFKTFMRGQNIDITLISSQTLILIGVVFNEFIGNRTDIIHQVCMDPLTNEYDVALIVK